ncbi:MAG: hypothetical protein CL610_20460 [Anaerolineaceae bacterium]|nr:hypothetical protein [Anaerolineaceae bacterium]
MNQEQIPVKDTTGNDPEQTEDVYIADPQTRARDTQDELSPVIVVARTTFNYILIAVVFLILGIFIGGFSAFKIERERRSWINEAIADAIAEQDFAGIIAAAQPPDLENPDSRFEISATSDHVLGPDDAPIVMIEFGDFNCGFCGRFHSETFPRLIENYGDQIQFIYRDYPILAESSLTAALAARCAGEQGEFWPYHDLLFENQSSFNQTGGFASLAEQAGLDVDAFNTCVEEQRFLSSVLTEYQEGQSLGIRGTPAFFINGRPISGAQPYDVFAEVIEEELAAAENMNTPEDSSIS